MKTYRELPLVAVVWALVAALGHAQAPDTARVNEIAVWLNERPYGATQPIGDRDFWQRIGRAKDYESAVANAETLLNRSFQPLPEELYLEYSRNGNRTRYERVFFQKLDDFRTLVIAECIEDRGRFLKSIQDLISSYAADRSWVLPAHDSGQENFEGRQITIDLFASEVACELANAAYILGDRLNQETHTSVRREITRRIFEPYTRMVTTGKPSLAWLKVTNNWNAVCLANVTGTALAMLEQPAEKAFYVAAAEKYITNFLDGFTEDGYCSEGIGYWNYGYGCFVRLAHLLHGATGGRLDLFAIPRARSAGMFARRMEITPGLYPAFADCGIGSTPSSRIMAYVSRRYDVAPSAWELRDSSSARWLDEIGMFSFLLEKSKTDRAAEPLAVRDWFENAGILICRGSMTGSGVPVAVALKGGHNAEHHNHNDLGSFVFCLGDKMTLVDPGAEVYTRRTFSADRYVSGVLNSFGHSVPRVAGQLQRTGRAASAEVLKLDLSEQQDTLQFDLTSAYPVKTLKQLTRTFAFHRASATLTVTDEVECASPEAFGTAIITFSPWQQLDDRRLRIGEGTGALEVQIDAAGFRTNVEPTTIDEDVRGAKQPTRIGIDLAEPAPKASIKLTICPAPG